MSKDNIEKCKKCDKVDALAYESIFDDALDMARTLKQIDAELNMAAMCEGDYPGGYPSEDLLPALCKLMYASQRSWMHPKYQRPSIVERSQKESEKRQK